MNSTPSLRRMWTMYKKLLVQDGASRRDQLRAQSEFYSGARCVLQVAKPVSRGRGRRDLGARLCRFADSATVAAEVH